ncbi:ABC transporter permease [Fulvivirga lutimaris]|uniref:ABC transporter permease n=1 Tax=Fulvivirga lutimaris TaxID=1819566 RepID=UPI0012BBB05F|nr:ABC transporter permease [Fulvivirga lutimaris]MTI40161.1 ABC transporter permease [Fulvivirga lutimaris]
MIRNYLITTLRNLVRNKVNTFINVVGLSMGIACALVLFLLAQYAKSYNAFEANYDRVYRIVHSSNGQGGEKSYTPGIPIPMAEAVREDFPEFEEVVLVRGHYGEMMFTVNPSSADPKYFELQEKQIVFTDNNYFKVFSKEWISGDPDKVLTTPGSTVISKNVADLLFPDGNAIGQNIVFNKQHELVIEGIVEEQPANSDMPFHIFIANATVAKEIAEARWNSISSDDQLYVLVPEKLEMDHEARLGQFVGKHFKNNEDNTMYHMQPMSDLHFNENWSNFSYNTVEQSDILTMIIIGIFLLITACINFINLSTAVALKRSKEVGVRKVMGGTKSQLAFQFLSESFVIILVSLMAALGLAELMIIEVNPFLGVNLNIDLTNPQFILLLFSGLIAVTFFSGFYPALVLSSFNPALALKNLITAKHSGKLSLRKGLVVFQFFISQLFIIGTIITMTQMDFIQNKDLGFDSEAVINVRIPEKDVSKQHTLKTEIEKLSGVENISLNFSAPSSGSVSVSNFYVEDNEEEYYTSMKFVDDKYIETYGIELLAGRNIVQSDTLKEVVVNQKLLRYIGFEDNYEEALGKQLRIWGRHIPIVGVVKDFHSVSLHDDIMTIALFSDVDSYRTASLKVNLAAFEDTNQQIEKIWKTLYPEYDYDYTFYDEQLERHYEGEQKMATIFSFFSIIAIIVGCMGLFGLASFMINQRMKEIGVRKTLGASVQSIVGMFSISFFKLIVIAFVFAVPLAWFAMDQWLSNFQYRIDMSPLLFSAGLLATLFVAILTVGFKSLRAAMVNPVDSLRDE